LKPLFSVVIPTFNSANKIHLALESVLAQTYENFEILIMDDGSTDNTAEIVSSYISPKIIYENDVNFGGPARPRNRGISLAHGEWICFLDADDWWTKDKLQTCYNNISDKVDLIYHNLAIVGGKPLIFRRKIVNSWQVKQPVLIDLILNGNPIANSSVVVRKSFLESIGGISENRKLIAAEDCNTWMRLAELTDQFLYLPKNLGFYLTHSQSLSKKDMSEPYIESIKEFLDSLNTKQLRIVESNASYISGRYYYFKKEYKVAIAKLLRSIIGGKNAIVMRAILYLIIIIIYKRPKEWVLFKFFRL
jgi:glycosyltransferase involved in cell wall biosynthesis